MPNSDLTPLRDADNLGARLQKRREGFGLSVSDMSASTHIREDYIEALERLDEGALPAIGYSLGFVRTYAKALGMDGNVAVKEYKADIALTKMPLRDAPHVILRRHIRLPRGFVSAISVASVAMLIGVWYGTQSEAIATPDPQPVLAPQYSALQPSEPIMQDGLFTLRATSPSWIQIRDAQGTVQVSRIFVTGGTWQGPTTAGYSVSVRDAGAIELYKGATLIGPLGDAGEPINGLTLSHDLSQSLPMQMLTDERP